MVRGRGRASAPHEGHGGGEEISATGHFHQIDDDALWQDLLNFLFSKGIVGFVKGKEIVVGKT